MRRAWPGLLVLAACGATASRSSAPAARPAETEAVREIAIAPMRLEAADGAEVIRLDASGAIEGACAAELREDGTLRRDGQPWLAIEGQRVRTASGEALFEIAADRLVRPGGRAAVIDPDGVIRFEESPAIVLRAPGADSPERARTALVLLAVASACGS